MSTVTIYHNLDCGTSRNVLALIRNSGEEPTVIEYLKTPPDRATLMVLIAAMGVSARAVLREKGTPYAELGLGDPLWAAATDSSTIALLEGVYRSGALVFGGGHVVLPLLQASVVPSGVVSNADFLAGYGAAQAVPGPLFTFSAYLGAVAHGPLHGWIGGLALLGTIFLPAFFMLVGALPFWEGLRHRAGIQTAMAGINAGVVGILVSALYDPVWTSAIHSKADFGLALLSFGLLTVGRVPPALVVLLAGLVGWVMAMGV